MSVQLQRNDHAAATPRVALPRLAYAALTVVLLALLVVGIATHGHWASAILGLLGPDLALLLGAGRGLAHGQLHPRAVPIYNAVHRFWGPAAVIALSSIGVLGPGWLVLGLAWALHVSLDRSVGYGLRSADGFQRAS